MDQNQPEAIQRQTRPNWLRLVWSSIKPTPTRMQKSIDLATKVFTGMLSAPATWMVAEQVYGFVPAEYRFLLQVASVGVVEGLFFGSLWLLETKKTLPDSEKVTNSLVLWSAYGLIVYVGLRHDGPNAMIFRAAIALYLVRITQGALAYAFRQRQKPTEKRPGLVTLVVTGLVEQWVVINQVTADASVRRRAIKTKRDAQIRALEKLVSQIEDYSVDELRVQLLPPRPNAPRLSPPAAQPNQTRFARSKKAKKQGHPKVVVGNPYKLQLLPDGEYSGSCPECSLVVFGSSRSVIGQLNGHQKTHQHSTNGTKPIEEQVL